MTAPAIRLPSRAVPLPVSLNLPEDLTFDEWTAVGKALQGVQRSLMWWIGDWLCFGEGKWGERYTEAIEITGKDYGTLRDAKWIAGATSLSRRRDKLSWAHHREVAALPAPTADALLNAAEAEGWSQKALRRHVRQDRERVTAALADLVDTGSNRHELFHSSLVKALDREAGLFDWIVTDPPYGREYLDVYSDLGRVAAHALKEGGSLLCMTGQSYLPEVLARLCEHLSYHWTLAYLTPGGQAVQIFPRRVNTFWKPVLWLTKADYQGDWIGDVTRSSPNDNDKRFHDWGQSESGMADLMSRFVKPGDWVMDPFMGGGTTGAVAMALGAYFVGYDDDDAAFNEAVVRLDRARLVA